jgi:hypothetical protein
MESHPIFIIDSPSPVPKPFISHGPFSAKSWFEWSRSLTLPSERSGILQQPLRSVKSVVVSQNIQHHSNAASSTFSFHCISQLHRLMPPKTTIFNFLFIGIPPSGAMFHLLGLLMVEILFRNRALQGRAPPLKHVEGISQLGHCLEVTSKKPLWVATPTGKSFSTPSSVLLSSEHIVGSRFF